MSVLVWTMMAMANGDGVLHPRRVFAALGVSQDALRHAGQDRSYSRTEVVALRADPARWLIAGREKRKAQRERERADRQRAASREAVELELADAYLRAFKDRCDTDAWAADVLHSADIPRIDLGDDEVVSILPRLELVR